MSNLINKLLGREDESEHHSATVVKTEAGGSSGQKGGSSGQASEGRTVQRDGVNIKSTISSDAVSTVSMANQQKLNDLVTKLGSTHTQIDDYAKKQSAQIDAQIQKEINEVVTRIRQEQDALLRKANEHTTQIDTEYRARLQQMVEEIDANKAKRIAEIEKDLNDQQTGILQQARSEIDVLNQKAANLKIGALQQGQARAQSAADAVTAQATNIGQAQTLHKESGTTTIKTEVTGGASSTTTGSSTSHASASGGSSTGGSSSGGSGGASGSSKTVETSYSQSGSSSTKH